MNMWSAVLIGSLLVYSWKLFGYLIPEKFVSSPKIKDLASLLTVSLLAALVGIQTFTSNQGIGIDARLPALIVAGILFYLRIPFVAVVVLAAATAALIRLMF